MDKVYEYRLLSSAERGREALVWLNEFVITNVLANEYRHRVFQKWSVANRESVVWQLRQIKHGEIGNVTLPQFSAMLECRLSSIDKARD